MLDFYYTPDTCSLATHVAMRDAGAEFRLHRIDFASEQQKSAEFTRINPKARVPALVTPDGVLTETPAMLAYVAQTHPASDLALMSDPWAFGQIQSFNNYLCATVHVAHAHRMRGHRWADEPEAHAAMQRKVPQSVALAFRFVEDHALQGPFVTGERYTVSDPYLYTIARWMEADGVDPSDFPKISAHREMMLARPTMQAALEAETAPH